MKFSLIVVPYLLIILTNFMEYFGKFYGQFWKYYWIFWKICWLLRHFYLPFCHFYSHFVKRIDRSIMSQNNREKNVSSFFLFENRYFLRIAYVASVLMVTFFLWFRHQKKELLAQTPNNILCFCCNFLSKLPKWRWRRRKRSKKLLKMHQNYRLQHMHNVT